MRLLLIGPPGSGKGTQAVALSDHFGIAHISSGELLRKHVADGTTLGRSVEEAISKGDLVPDAVVMDILRKPVEAASRNGGYVLDGFPRTVAQAEAAYLVAKEIDAWVQVALYLDVPREQLLARIRHRAEGRSDDHTDVALHRQDVFEQLTRPMLDYYARREILVRVDGTLPIADVTATAIAELERVRPHLS